MSGLNGHRPAYEWLEDLQKAKNEGNNGNKPKITVADLMDRVNAVGTDAQEANASEGQLIPTSPRSVEACFRLGIDPIELAFKPMTSFKRPGEDADIASLRFKYNESIRQDRLKALIDERKHLIDEGIVGTGPNRVAKQSKSEKREAHSSMVDKERQRLDVLKKRQERELQQMMQFEIQRQELLDKQQKKMDMLERRAQELARQKAEHDAQWQSQQRERELAKAREEEEREKEAKRIMQERYRREQEQMRLEQEEAARRKKEAYMKEMERRQKVEEARREAEAELERQAEEVRQRKLEMERRNLERMKRLQQEQMEKQLVNQDKRKKADTRIQSAIQSSRDILQKRRDEFMRREAEADMKRREMEESRTKSEEHKRQEEARKQAERRSKYMAAVEYEEMRKETIRSKSTMKERLLYELSMQRKKENDIRRLEREIQAKLKLDKVDALDKMKAYQRHTLLQKIHAENDRTRQLLLERQALQEQRKWANMQASLNRQALNQMAEQMRCKKSFSSTGNLSLPSEGLKRRPASVH